MLSAEDLRSVVKSLTQIAEVAGKYGVSVVIFAFAPLVGCFGLYFMWMTMSNSQLNIAKVIVGVFAIVFGSAYSILLLYLFTRMNLWDKLGLSKFSEEQNKAFSEIQSRVAALQALESRVRVLEDEGKARRAMAS
jgi:hypothetical protein